MVEAVLSAKKELEKFKVASGANPYQWGRVYRIMDDGLTYSIMSYERYQGYLYEPYLEVANMAVPGGKIVVMKCVQTGWTEWALNSTFWFMDTKHEPALYMLPTEKQLSAFVQARVDKAISNSEYISAGFSDAGAADSVGLKNGWGQSLYFRGAKSAKSIVEFSAGMVVQDEKNNMETAGIVASHGRQQGMINKWTLRLSNPTIPEFGIHLDWLGGSQGEWALWCPVCKEYVVPRWPDSANRNHPKTPMCPSYDHELDKMRGKWIHAVPDAPYKSYTMSHFSSPRSTPVEMLDKWDSIQGDATEMGGFWNLEVGQPWAPEGTRLTDVSGLPSMGEMVPSYSRQSVMGVDVGTLLHVVIRRTYGGILWAGALPGSEGWDQLGRMMAAYSVVQCAIDVRPETTKATDFARLFPGRVVVVEYNPNPLATEAKWKEKNGVPMYSGLRTPMLDEAMALFHTNTEAVPSNLPTDFWAHFSALSRQYVKRSDGKVYAAYMNVKADHFAHSFNYAVFAGKKFQGSAEEQVQFFSPKHRGKRG